jgi:myo-inositol 2-dehydrogenase/D-chiro-inositol 1-dehydrogenase
MDRIADMLDGTDAAVGYADGVKTLALAETAAKSIITGKPVRP